MNRVFLLAQPTARCAVRRVNVLLAMGVLCGLVGCEALRESERSYTVSYDADSKSGALSMTLRPGPSRAAVVPQPVFGMDDATIARIVRLIEASALRNARVATDAAGEDATAGWGQPALPRPGEESGKVDKSGKAVSLGESGGVVLDEMPVIGGK